MKTTTNTTKLVADVLAMISFSIIIGAIIEVGLVGLTWKQSLLSRIAAMPINGFVGRPQGWWIDTLRSLLGQEGWRKWVSDMVGFVTMQTLVFCTSVTIGMWMDGNFSWHVLWKAGYIIIPILPFLGPLYGWWQDIIRRVIIINKTKPKKL